MKPVSELSVSQIEIQRRKLSKIPALTTDQKQRIVDLDAEYAKRYENRFR